MNRKQQIKHIKFHYLYNTAVVLGLVHLSILNLVTQTVRDQGQGCTLHLEVVYSLCVLCVYFV